MAFQWSLLMSKILLTALITSIMLLGLNACGQKGALYLPKPEPLVKKS